MLPTTVRALFDRAVAARDVLTTTGVARTITPAGVATLARRFITRTLPKGPTAILSVHAAHKPDQEALVDLSPAGSPGAISPERSPGASDTRLTFRQLDERIDRLARALLALGVRKGDKIAVMMRNGHRYLLTQWAALRVGAAVVQIGYRLKAGEVAHILGNAEPVVMIHDADLASVVGEATAQAGRRPRTVTVPEGFDALLAREPDQRLRPEGDGASAAVMVYTSGTTGRPKGAPRSLEKALHDSVLDFIRQVGIRTDERHLVVAPLYHSAAPVFIALIYALGGAVVMLEHFDPEQVLRAIDRERITSAFMVPTMLARLAALPVEVRRRYDTSSIRWLMSGAAPLPTDTARRIEEWMGPVLYNFYGSTETGLVTLALPGEHTARPGTVGRALLGNEIRLLDDDGREVKPGEVGELFVRSTMLVHGYHRDREATSQAMREGFFSVGDLGRVDEAGYYYLADRKHDMVISGGVNIYPWEIEQHLHTHPEIADVAVIGVPDPDWGESLKAFVVRSPGSAIDAAEVQRYCKSALADYKTPRSVVFVDALPRLPTGKVLKRELRKL
ncbi:MAG: AMP-binding protein [Deltaproteobacteria bacterium]|nr:AMP-binding protein [Deltaproteobacteria bacterium]